MLNFIIGSFDKVRMVDYVNSYFYYIMTTLFIGLYILDIKN